MSVTVNNSPIQVYSPTYNFTQLIMLNLLWNNSWIQTFYCFIYIYIYYTNCHTFVVRITLKRWMPWTSKFLHFSYRIMVLSKYVVTILVSTDFTWWLLLIGLSWLPYAFGCAACLVAPSSSGAIPGTHLLLMGWKIILYKSLFFTCYPGYLRNMFILQSISYSLQGSYVLSVELLFPKTTTYGLPFFFFSLIFLFLFYENIL